jgi:hypothetical protein
MNVNPALKTMAEENGFQKATPMLFGCQANHRESGGSQGHLKDFGQTIAAATELFSGNHPEQNSSVAGVGTGAAEGGTCRTTTTARNWARMRAQAAKDRQVRETS